MTDMSDERAVDTDLAIELRLEADASEELDAENSSVAVMRRAADELNRLAAALPSPLRGATREEQGDFDALAKEYAEISRLVGRRGTEAEPLSVQVAKALSPSQGPTREQFKQAVRGGHWFRSFVYDATVGAAEVEAFLDEIADNLASLPPQAPQAGLGAAGERENDKRYNAGIITAIMGELIGPVERERLAKLPWARSLVNDLVQRIANLRAQLASPSPLAADGWQFVPSEPSDDAAQLLSRLSHGYSVGERIESGRRVYAQLLKMLPASSLIAEHREKP